MTGTPLPSHELPTPDLSNEPDWTLTAILVGALLIAAGLALEVWTFYGLPNILGWPLGFVLFIIGARALVWGMRVRGWTSRDD